MILTLGSFAFFTALVAAITWWKTRGGDAGSNDGFFYHFVGACFLLLLDVMLLLRIVAPLREPHEFADAKAVSLEPWKGAWMASAALVVVILGIYAAFADFSVLRDAAGNYPFFRFASRAVPAVIPTLALIWLDRRLDRAGR